MKIKNTSKKLIHIGNIPLMPGDEATVADSVGQTPAVQVLTKHGLLATSAAGGRKKDQAPEPPKNPPQTPPAK